MNITNQLLTSRNPTEIADLLNRGADREAVDRDKMTILCLMCKEGFIDIVRILVEAGSNIDHEAQYGRTPLTLAIENYNLEIVKYLIEKGASVSKCKPLSIAIIVANYDAAKVLIENGANVNSKSRYGVSALFDALVHGHTEIAKLLIANGADINNVSQWGDTALNFAPNCKDFDLIKTLVETSSIDINHRSNDGQTAIQQSCYACDIQIVDYLISKGANIHIKDNNGLTPLFIALSSKNYDVAKYLIQKHDNMEFFYETFLKLCKARIGEEGEGEDDEWRIITEPINFLCKNGYDINYVNHNGKTALIGLCSYENCTFEYVQLAITNGANPNVQDRKGNTALIYAVKMGLEAKIVEYLIESGADLWIKNREDKTCFDYHDSEDDHLTEILNNFRE